MAYITNSGAKLIDRARNEGKSIAFGSVRMNTIYESTPSELVQKSDSWYGAIVGQVVGCLSHVSVDRESRVCDSKLAIRCDDNSKPWKSIGIYAHLDGEEGETLLACESIQNGDYKNITLVELPVTLDGVVEDFGLSEGSGGGGGDVPANMMTTDTTQGGLSGEKQWNWEDFAGSGSRDEPQDGDIQTFESFSIVKDEGIHIPLVLDSIKERYIAEAGAWKSETHNVLQITSGEVYFNGLTATWNDIINAANSGGGGGDVPENMMTTDTYQEVSGKKEWWGQIYEGSGTKDEPQVGDIRTIRQLSISYDATHLSSETAEYEGDDSWLGTDIHDLVIDAEGVTGDEIHRASWVDIINAANSGGGGGGGDIRARQDMVQDDGEGNLMIFGQTITPDSDLIVDSLLFTFDSSGYLKSVCLDGAIGVATIGVIVRDENGEVVTNGRVSGVSIGVETLLTFQSPIQLAAGYLITYQAIISSLSNPNP